MIFLLRVLACASFGAGAGWLASEHLVPLPDGSAVRQVVAYVVGFGASFGALKLTEPKGERG